MLSRDLFRWAGDATPPTLIDNTFPMRQLNRLKHWRRRLLTRCAKTRRVVDNDATRFSPDQSVLVTSHSGRALGPTKPILTFENCS